MKQEVMNSKYEANQVPLVSVCMIAYNVSRYIDEAVMSVLTQVTDFKVELVIGEDCSTDNTRGIALSYQQKYPNVVRVLTPDHNQGLTPNCIATHNACTGKYVALLDADDFWTSTDKLQKQIDFLEKNEKFSGCAHQSMNIYDDGSPSTPFGSANDQVFGTLDTISHRKFHTSSLVYRKWIWDKCNGIPPGISSNERAIYPMISIFGDIKYFGESMCVYRHSGLGLSSRVDYKELETDLDMLPWLKRISKKFPVNRFRSFLHLCVYTYGTKRIPLGALLKHYFLFTYFSFSYFPQNLGDLKWGSIFFYRRLFNKKL